MRLLPFLLLVALAVPAAGHGEAYTCTLPEPAIGHLEVWDGTVPAGESISTLTAFAGCTMPEGWWLNYWMDGPGLELTVTHDDHTFGPWAMNGTQFIQLPSIGYPRLTVYNPSDAPADFRLYFDHTCDCTGKAVPVSGGGIWFNTPAQADDEVAWAFRFTPVAAHADATGPVPEHFTVRLAHVTPSLEGPVERDVVTQTFGPEDSCGQSERFIGCLDATFQGSAAGVQYLWMEVTHDGGVDYLIQVAPEFDVQEQAPGASAVLLVLGLLALTRLRR